LAEGVVRVDDVPAVGAVLGHLAAGAVGQHVAVVAVVEGVLVAGFAGQLGGGGADVDEDLLLGLGDGGDGERGGRGGHVQDHVGVLSVVELLGLGVGDLGFVLVVGGHHVDLLGHGLVAVLGPVVLDG